MAASCLVKARLVTVKLGYSFARRVKAVLIIVLFASFAAEVDD